MASRTSYQAPHTPHFSVPYVLTLILLLLGTSSAFGDTLRVTVDRALVWTRPSGVSVVITQLTKDAIVEVVRRAGDWYEILLPAGTFGGETRSGYISASQVVIETVGPPSAQVARATTASPPRPSTKNTSFVNIDGVYRVGRDDLTRTTTAFSDLFAEEGTIASNYGDATGWSVDVLAGAAVVGSLGVGVGVSYSLREKAAVVDARVPHPFFFDQLRPATFETEPLSAYEAALHIPAIWMPPAFGPVRVLVFGGPSIFRFSQTVVTDVALDERYPYDTVAIRGITTEERKGTVFGYHAGTDVSVLVTRSVGVGAGVRYSRGTIKFEDDEDATTVGLAGALQAVAGLRFAF